MAKVTWSARVDEGQKVELENCINEILRKKPGEDRGTILLKGVKAINEQEFIDQCEYREEITSGYEAVEHIKDIMTGFATAASVAKEAAAQKYLKRIQTLEAQSKTDKEARYKVEEELRALADQLALMDRIDADFEEARERNQELYQEKKRIDEELTNVKEQLQKNRAMTVKLSQENAKLKTDNAVLEERNKAAIEANNRIEAELKRTLEFLPSSSHKQS